ncbi:transcription antitermination protein NusB [Leptospira ryugenii]|uniref:Transcription antitermination protein NusB n=1 Tax=Leptospira ryugenii TaxID=1917863 RepID=A0A2P2DYF9_9LEPT|nr:transcription antitermination factor NusB [Leptospira ryugenii]GBF49636.1 transcription antitermination protein NusB [Leptospira ryugenii]
MSSRHRGRSIALMCLYQIDLVGTEPARAMKFDWYDKKISKEEKDYAVFLVKGVVENKESIDTLIKKYSENWELSRISVVNRCILRLSILSLQNEPFLAGPVVINEAVELTKEFETEESAQFINGLLDAFYKKEILANQKTSENGPNPKK